MAPRTSSDLTITLALHTRVRPHLAHTVSHLATVAPRTFLYVDAGHGGWLGWDRMAAAFVKLVCVDLGVSPRLLRGFSTNVANYNGVGEPCPPEAFDGAMNAGRFCNHRLTRNHSCCAAPNDDCRRVPRYSSGFAEIVYAQTLAKHAKEQCVDEGGQPLFEPRVVIDSGRAGNSDARTPEQCHDWCNLRTAGVGPTPTTSTPLPELVDALFWVKYPGESDGCSEVLPGGDRCARYDAGCGRATSLGSGEREPSAPEAGQWFAAHVLSLARNAHLHFSGGVGHGLLRGEHVPSAAEERAAQAEQGEHTSVLSELWHPSSRCVVLLVGVTVFACICACGLSLALMATYGYRRGGGEEASASTAHSHKPPWPRHRALASHFNVKYLCEPKLGGPGGGGGGAGGGRGGGGRGGEATTALMAAVEPSSGSELELAPARSGSCSRDRSPFAQLGASLGAELEPPPTPRMAIAHGRPVLGGCALAASVRHGDLSGAVNVLSDLESASDRDELDHSGVSFARGGSFPVRGGELAHDRPPRRSPATGPGPGSGSSSASSSACGGDSGSGSA